MTKLYKSLGNDPASQNDLPPQAKVILAEIQRSEVIKRDDLLASLRTKFEQYRQSPEHVLAFYRKRLIDGGYVMELTI
jgi:hypothetical protein